MHRKAALISFTLLVLFNFSADAGTSFVRWGRKVCPTGTSTLYRGYTAGKYFASSGSGSNYICMHEDPKFVRPKAGRQGGSGLIFGVEFDDFAQFDGIFKTDNMPGGRILDQDMPCVVCYVEGSYDHIMVPGRPDCGNSGYDFQYGGFLVSAAHDQPGSTQYICMDETPEGIVGGSADNNQGIVYTVELGCISLPCNPFVEGYEVPCAVCTY